ncbi:CHAT domain-containing protein [Pontibacter harenae]|uniref:CHAT domain-containing protein n=1 Tax=Pontibacter harenae TaxID=2894083 RepID=UPI001E489DD4|nr:CHAT domain-containing protein [Pontibacter harenae]MCC9166355.1 CHAT domain-containing protein [Pontibacter harenae]
MTGAAINKELSFLRPNNFKQPNYKLIQKFGEKLKNLILTTEIERYLEKRNGQVFVISDLPIEWLSINEVPLCFTHDVCRMPEANYGSLYSAYSNNRLDGYDIPNDILSKTLVILGASEKEGKDEGFKKAFPLIEDLSSKKSFQTRRCLSIDDVAQAVNELKPELLIFDCHGGFDEKTSTSFLVINGERLTGDDIVKHNITAPLVFLSACNTSPNYGYLYTIGEDFLYAGAFSVTTTFTPISIGTGFGNYTRLINELEHAIKFGTYKNWLEFVAYVTRTSILYEAYVAILLKKNLDDLKQHQNDSILAEIDRRVIMFKDVSYRRQIFQEFKQGIRIPGTKKPIKLEDLNGDFLSYSHLGRADLILFKSWIENQKSNGD